MCGRERPACTWLVTVQARVTALVANHDQAPIGVRWKAYTVVIDELSRLRDLEVGWAVSATSLRKVAVELGVSHAMVGKICVRSARAGGPANRRRSGGWVQPVARWLMLRRSTLCVGCGVRLEVGSRGWVDPEGRTVECGSCAPVADRQG